MSQPLQSNYDAIMIGGGPAGTSTAAVLASHGHRVLVIERDRFPRYRIGESLIPFTYQPLERIGMIPKMRASSFVKKYSVSFVQPDGKRSQPFYFHTRYDKETVAQTWQVTRAEFDQMMMDNAREKGAEVVEGTTVTRLLTENDATVGVEIKSPDGTLSEVRARITVDCSGKEAFTSTRNSWRVRDPFLNKVAVWTYYEGSKRECGLDEGATTIAFVPEKGWFWHIPQHNDRVSVGIVAEGKYLTRDGVRDLKAIFDREVLQNEWIREHLAEGQQVGDYFITSEYSHHSKYCAAPGLLLAGDAFAFLDPVFSSGVMLALKSGVLAADLIHQGLEANDLSPARFEPYGQAMRQGVENMRKLVYAFYNPDFSFKDVVMKYPEASGELTDCLSGDVNKDFSALWSKISEFVPLPDELPYGKPMPMAA
ncbi:MAG: tryptophan 7-halogenase [Verrucomicrobiaceae bacterium]|nr:tryptophan 7-halogenase [Verrucomicrobiaceae bacterium]